MLSATAIAAAAAIAVVSAGCDSGGEASGAGHPGANAIAAQAAAGTQTQPQQTQAGSSFEEKEVYKQAVNGLTSRANFTNADFHALIDKFNTGQAQAENLSAAAERGRLVYQDMVAKLSSMKVPPEFQQFQPQLISGFGKWQSTFEAYRDGYGNKDNSALARALDLDRQALGDVNQAVNQISQVR